MAIGERIHFFRTMRGMTQKYLGMALGFPEKSADVRLAQYENGSRTPKADVTAALAQALDVSPKALDVPDIDSYTGLMHTLFTLEDRYGLEVCESDGEVHLRVHIQKGRDAAELHRMRRTNLDTLAVELQKVKGCFDEIFDLYNDIQDDFRVIFHSLQKDTFVEYLTDKEYDEYFG